MREALNLLFDVEWINRNLYGGLYKRTQSFFERSALSSFGFAADARERKLLRAVFGRRDASRSSTARPSCPPQTAPATTAPTSRRPSRCCARPVIASTAGAWCTRDGKQLAFEMLATSRGQERLLLTYARALEALGIAMTLRIVDSAQYEARLKDGNFDMIQTHWAASLSPGNEQLARFGSGRPTSMASRNYAGVKSPAVDAMIGRCSRRVARGVHLRRARLRPRAALGQLCHPAVPPAEGLGRASHGRSKGRMAETNGGFDLDTWWRKSE